MGYSVAVFGSCARNDFDNLSDKDILFVYDDNFYPSKEIKNMQSNGWNCSEYTYKEFQNISSLGSLFVQHIKQDSIIKKDDDNILKNILLSYTPKKDYTADIIQAEKNFTILKYIENSSIGALWALDVISVLLRNYSVLRLANNNIYEFSLSRMYSFMMELYGFDDREFQYLCKLRYFKYIYRHKQQCDFHEIKKFLSDILAILSQKLSLDIRVNFLQSKDFIIKQLEALMNEKGSGYKRLRIFESIYNAVPQIHGDIVVKKYEKMICNPSKYAYTFQCADFIDHISLNYSLRDSFEKYL
ncbi:nucleotidyltransferase domain-containing protein [Desulfovibrio piger]|uniref:nucleotidyltransferase domain-containing protein n=1 Tax=Desulfovibrio piger TaxID=901 RepID=UPI00242D5A83|nr:nucleotidyltransferase domain-containing protein [Desulfovibrio piger]MCI7506932.1 nucleotidyltransferase domain-containing protein [Desulfovibrio piger]